MVALSRLRRNRDLRIQQQPGGVDYVPVLIELKGAIARIGYASVSLANLEKSFSLDRDIEGIVGLRKVSLGLNDLV